MQTKTQKIIKIVFRFLCLAVWLAFFVILVKPEIAKYAIPKLINFTETYAESNSGIDLDPILASSLDDYSGPSSSLYATKFGDSSSGIYGDLVTSDTRVIALNRFLVDYGSPMAPYAETFVTSAEDVGLDWRLVPAISGVESAFGRIIPYNSYNAWGWRGGAYGAFSEFGSWENGIEHVTTRIAVGYGTDIDVFTMEPIYCPPCGQNPQHAWANGVARYMAEISEYRKNL
ncbi:hypothetical protein JW710_00730 [Candidatus Dojkabacteria bacterium]|nr:hypothetical protein [Candidatus Dojkabacteria bacterium]